MSADLRERLLAASIRTFSPTTKALLREAAEAVHAPPANIDQLLNLLVEAGHLTREHANAAARISLRWAAPVGADASLRDALQRIVDFDGDPKTPVRTCVKLRGIARAALAAATQEGGA